jgi:hypothetical protein
MIISIPFRKKLYLCKVSVIRVTIEQGKQMNAVVDISESNKIEEIATLTHESAWN